MKIENEDVTFVIPTNREKAYTLDSIPPESQVYIERKGNLNQARNRGIKKAKTDLIIVCDDDIRFDLQFLETVFSRLSRNTLVGLEDYYGMKWCIGRFMCFWKDDWEIVGGFDEGRPKYGGDDTDFCIRMENAGIKIIRLPRDSVDHIYPEKVRPAREEMKSLLYLIRKHPKQMLIPAFKLIFRKITGAKL